MLSGFLNIDKPIGLTSHDVVARVRRLYRQQTGSKKVGHAGTLDPLATGVLVVCLGAATRLSDYVMHTTKIYRAEVQLGVETDTYDAEGEIVARHDAAGVTQADIATVLNRFTGDIEQVPPMHSAIKVNGKKLYELARAGQTIERAARPVTIHAIDLISYEGDVLTIDVTCGSGTYIRSLAHDIGAELGVGAHLTALRRMKSGDFDVNQAVTLEQLDALDDWSELVIQPAAVLSHCASVTLSDDQMTEISFGRFIELNETALPEGDVMAYTPQGQLLAVLEPAGTQWKPRKVFPIGAETEED